MKQKNDPHLVADESALLTPTECFETLYTRYVHQVYQRCVSLMKDTQQAHDLTQDIFLKVLTNWDQFEGRSRRSTWLYTITFNQCMDQLKRNKRWCNLGETLELELAEPEQTEGEGNRLNQLLHVLTRLPSQDVELLRLRYEDNLSIKTIARQLAIKESAVKMRLMRARRMIAAQLDNLGANEAV